MISTRGRYAIRVMLDLAENDDRSLRQAQEADAGTKGCIPLKDIAARQGISKKYLEIIVKNLVEGGLVIGVSGKGGGYRLARLPEEISIGEVLERTEGPLAPVACLAPDASSCPRAGVCETLPLWAEYDRLTHDYFYGKRLSDLLPKKSDP